MMPKCHKWQISGMGFYFDFWNAVLCRVLCPDQWCEFGPVYRLEKTTVCSLTPAPHLLSPDRWFPSVLFWSLLSSSELSSSTDLPLWKREDDRKRKAEDLKRREAQMNQCIGLALSRFVPNLSCLPSWPPGQSKLRSYLRKSSHRWDLKLHHTIFLFLGTTQTTICFQVHFTVFCLLWQRLFHWLQ